jgi:heterogeneous nuclear ribonucleoprotein A1/A3
MGTRKLFVGGLSWDTDDAGLRAAFVKYGEIREARVITDRDTGRSRGFGFVTFDIEPDAIAAMKVLDGSTLDGRKIRVNEAEEKRPNGSGPSNHNSGSDERRGGGSGDTGGNATARRPLR